MINAQCEKPRLFSELGRKGSKILLNRYCYLLLFCLAAAVSVLRQEVLGAVLFVFIICIFLVVSDDLVTVFLPLLLMCVFLTSCYDSSSTFIKFAWLAVPVVAAFIFHFAVYRGEFVLGSSIWGLFAVAVAVTMGGISWISGFEYFNLVSFYYMIFLGVGMIAFYIGIKSQFSRKRDYDLKEQIALIFYIMGVFACFVALFNVMPEIKTEKGLAIPTDFQPANNLSTFMMFALPCPFYFARKNKAHLVIPFVMLAAMFFSGSRAGLLLGTAEIIVCLLIWIIFDKRQRFFYICLTIFFVGFVAVFKSNIIALLSQAGLYPFVSEDETRVKLIRRAFKLFFKNPIFGHGLGYQGLYDLYCPKTGAMGWYHMMIPQIIGSMGIVGIAAYLYQGINQLRIVFKAYKNSVDGEKFAVLTLMLSYVGILLMSQVNPGLFCPLPYYLMAVILFATMDGSGGIPFIVSAYGKITSKFRKKVSVAEIERVAEKATDDTESVDTCAQTAAAEETTAERVRVVAKRITKKDFDELSKNKDKSK